MLLDAPSPVTVEFRKDLAFLNDQKASLEDIAACVLAEKRFTILGRWRAIAHGELALRCRSPWGKVQTLYTEMAEWIVRFDLILVANIQGAGYGPGPMG